MARLDNPGELTPTTMVKFNLLIGDPSNINTRGLYSPLLDNRQLLSENQISVRLFTKCTSNIWDCDVLGVDSKYYRTSWQVSEESTLKEIEQVREKVPVLIWFNTADSTGGIQAQVMPLVDLYCKAQMLREPTLYQKPMYGGRVYTDYFHRSHNISDDQPLISRVVSPLDLDKKLRVFWNYGLARGYAKFGRFEKMRSRIHAKGWPLAAENNYYEPDGIRPNAVFLRMQIDYPRNSVSIQRKKTVAALRRFGASSERASKRQYFREMARSKVVVSPFGWGEINIRDFECFTLGSLLVKPSMSHLETYPRFFVENETYIPYRWDCSDVTEKIGEVIQNYSRYVWIAREAQERFKSALETKESQEEFVQRVHQILEEALENRQTSS